tara:strand:+ start:8838 stop:9371 length:534 start_codon:yes stop_codon:yes gene_type:complete
MKILNTVLTTVIIASMIACGGEASDQSTKKSENSTTEKQETKEVVEETEVKEKQEVSIELIAKGETMAEISFEPKTLSIPANSKVKLTFKNQSSAAGMLHNFVLVKLGTGQEVSTQGIQAGADNNFIPDNPNVLVHTKILNMGETIEIEFDAPAKGSYHYICTYPGHTSMIGRLNVE